MNEKKMKLEKIFVSKKKNQEFFFFSFFDGFVVETNDVVRDGSPRVETAITRERVEVVSVGLEPGAHWA